MPQYRKDLIDVATGRLPADLYIEGGRVLNVYSGELLKDTGIAIIHGRIACVGSARRMIGPNTRIINARDGILVPGYLDPHAHFDNLLSLPEVARSVLPLGTTALVNDTQPIVARYGAAGLEYLQKVARQLPLRNFFTLPACAYAPELEELGVFGGFSLTDAEMRRFLADPDVVGTAEFLPWRSLMTGDPRMLARLELARSCGKLCEGHSPGARSGQIQALAAAGVTDCHESLSADEALERLRAGLYLLLRHGPARYDLSALAPLVLREGVDRSRIMLTPDWLPPNDLVRDGHMDFVIDCALREGIPPLDAYRMVTLNPARYFRIEDRVGAIAPGRHADILCLESLSKPRPQWVMAGGALVSGGAEPAGGWSPSGSQAQLPPYRPSPSSVSARDFAVRAGEVSEALVPAIRIVDKTVTRRVDLRLPVRDGQVIAEGHPEPVLKLAMPDGEGGFALGFLVGVGTPLGALSSSLASEPYPTLVSGASDTDMALAYNRMVELGGGLVAVQDGRVEVELPLALGGFFSTEPATEVGRGLDAVNRWAMDCGSHLDNFFLTHHFLTYVGVPYLRMTPRGLFDVKDRRFLPQVIEHA